jgi:hypothetical protein
MADYRGCTVVSATRELAERMLAALKAPGRFCRSHDRITSGLPDDCDGVG